MISYDFLLYEVDDRVATITLNRPQKHNALRQPLINGIIAVVAKADADPEVRVLIVISAGGRAFAAGYDVKDTANKPNRTLAEWCARMQKDIKFTYSVWDCSKPVIAMIDGFCYASGWNSRCVTISVVARDTTRFAAIEARFSNGMATMITPWLVGQRSPALLYTGDSFDSSEAFRLGLVDKKFPKATLRAERMKFAKRMSRVSLDCLKLNKRAVNQAFETMVLRNAMTNSADGSANMDAVRSPETDRFDAVRRSNGLAAALKWRTDRLAPYE